jgi:hypothetical protein
MNTLIEENRVLKTASLSEEEREQQAEEEAASYVEDLERRAVLGEIAQKFPKAAPHFQKLFEFGSAEEQAAYLESLLTPTPPEPSDAVPPVDPNNPPTQPVASTGGVYVDPNTGEAYTKEMRRQILSGLTQPLADMFKGR